MGVLRAISSMFIQTLPDSQSPYQLHRAMNFEIVGSRGQVIEREALLITRPGNDVPDGWKSVLVGSAPGFLGPRELPKLREVIVSYLKNRPGGAVVIDCPEYLAVYNGFKALMRFLHAIRDYAILYKGKVYLVTGETAWDGKEYAVLRGLEV
ncbi:DUF835 domain-containing protein [Thermococcus sp.]|uniref:DUF835 domain-containing protein n=1 Tax=Thermococcus sp. TaxID=35749 RepID=UPI0026349F34|nr:DUF835 domain-containing protein [Thermococcus sp.]